jgi:hypothetical protein
MKKCVFLGLMALLAMSFSFFGCYDDQDEEEFAFLAADEARIGVWRQQSPQGMIVITISDAPLRNTGMPQNRDFYTISWGGSLISSGQISVTVRQNGVLSLTFEPTEWCWDWGAA